MNSPFHGHEIKACVQLVKIYSLHPAYKAGGAQQSYFTVGVFIVDIFLIQTP